MVESSWGGLMCGGVGGRQDFMFSVGGSNFLEYEFFELNMCVFYVGVFGELWCGWLCGLGDLLLKELLVFVLFGC